jgi:hypothetical protein
VLSGLRDEFDARLQRAANSATWRLWDSGAFSAQVAYGSWLAPVLIAAMLDLAR